MGGAGMVVAEMTCTSPDARITPGCPGLWNDAAAGRLDAHRRFRPPLTPTPRSPCSWATPGAKGSTRVPWEGEDQPLEHGQLAAGLGIAAAVRRRRERLVARHDARRHGPGARRLRAQHAAGRRRRLRLAGTALRPRLPAVQFHLAADQPAHRRSMAARWRTGCAIRSRCSARCAQPGRSTCRCRCAFRRTTGSKAASRPTTPWRSRAPSRPPAPT